MGLGGNEGCVPARVVPLEVTWLRMRSFQTTHCQSEAVYLLLVGCQSYRLI